MALVDCRECGGQVSTRAKACPHCGDPRGRGGLWVKIWIGSTLLVGLLYIGLIVGYALYLRSLF